MKMNYPNYKHNERTQQNFYLQGINAIKKSNWTEALKIFKTVLESNPSHLGALHNLGAIYNLQGNLNEAQKIYHSIILIDTKAIKTYYNLANIYKAQERYSEALRFFTKTLELDPTHSSARHMHDALSNNSTDCPPGDYVEKLFDQFSNHFDKTLSIDLSYQTPQKLFNFLNEQVGQKTIFKDVLDLGCGTGLSGEAFHKVSTSIIGVDISSEMLKKASEKKLYSQLIHKDIVTFLSNNKDHYDLVLAVDVLVYSGNLEPLFSELETTVSPRGYFVFSIEISEIDDYMLQKSGRYAHSKQYIEKLCNQYGFLVQSFQKAFLRSDHHKRIDGYNFIVVKN